MRKISDILREFLSKDEIAFSALKRGWLNLSAYASSVQPQLEEVAWKEVKHGSLVVALSRMQQEVGRLPDIKPEIILDDLSLKSPLCDVTFVRTTETVKKARALTQQMEQDDNHFLTITQSLHEITVIAPQDSLDMIKEHFQVEPKAVFLDLVALTVRFSFRYLDIPNFMYAVMGILASHHINIVEIVSTLTELSMIIRREDMPQAVSALQEYLGKEKLS